MKLTPKAGAKRGVMPSIGSDDIFIRSERKLKEMRFESELKNAEKVDQSESLIFRSSDKRFSLKAVICT